MTMRDLLVRGMLAGIIASVLATAFAFTIGEPAIERAIAIEEQNAAAGMPAGHDRGVMTATAAEPEEASPVSREMQRTAGLVAGMLALGVAFGGVFAIVFAFARGRLGITSDRGTALTVAMLIFAAFYLVPFLKYPANPPAVGHGETIEARTAAYVGMLLASVLLMIAAVILQRWLAEVRSRWDASILAGIVFGALVVAVSLLMPGFSEVPEGFPADVLWHFRLASLGTQLTMWLGIGLAFGVLMDRAARPAAYPAQQR